MIRYQWLISLILFSSCEKAISFIPASTQPSLVVEAVIENNKAPVVTLSRSLDYFSNISPELAAGSFVRNAVIKISNGVKTHLLREYEVKTNQGYSLFYYSNDTAAMSSAFEGQLGEDYTLQILVDGREYSAATTIPPLAKKIDALNWEEVEGDDETLIMVSAEIYDPPGLGNYIRYFTQRNGERFFPAFNSVFDDQVIDGKNYLVQMERGIDRNFEVTDNDNYSFFERGDKVTVKWCNINKQVFDFWRTMEYNYSSIGNPFSSPGKVLGNISGGALGYFGGYAAQYVSISIPQ